MTPRHPGERTSSSSSHHASSAASGSGEFATPATPGDASARGDSTIRRHHHSSTSGDKEKGEQRRKKKQFYSKIKKEEDEQMAELARKYRDRAKERRDGGLPESSNDDLITAQGAYRAVAPDFRAYVYFLLGIKSEGTFYRNRQVYDDNI
jgi:IK cytokine